MITFFRRIRQRLFSENKFSKYLGYAIGEIVLVVIGILIALSINNWNEQRKANDKERATLMNLLQDLKADSLSFRNNRQTLKDINSLHKSLYDVGVANKLNVTIENPHYIRRGLDFNPITGDNDPFIANKISNEIIRDEILVYFRLIKSMEGIRGNFGEVVRAMRGYLGETNAHSLPGWFESPTPTRLEELRYDLVIESEKLIELSKTAAFQQLLMESSIKCVESSLILERVINQNAALMQTIKEEFGE